MGWGSGIGVVALTTALAGLAAYCLANFLIWQLPVSNFEGGAGYFSVILIMLGVVGGLFVGIVMAATVRSGFVTAQLYASGAVVVLTVAVAVVVVMLNDNGPMIDGDPIVLETELRFPSDWKPDNYALFETGSGCLMQKSGTNESPDTQPSTLWQQKNASVHPLYRGSILGDLILRSPPTASGQWTISCVVELAETTSPRFMRIYAGHRTDVTTRIPLPRHPDSAFLQWSQWSTADFVPQTGKPTAEDYAFRFKVQRKTDYDTANTVESDSDKAAKMPPDAPLVQWLPFFESSRGAALKYYEVATPAIQAVKDHAADLPSLLRSSDPTVVRRAVFATIALDPIPSFVIGPLANSGRHAIDLIREARVRALPGDPDLVGEQSAHEFYAAWAAAMGSAGGTAAQDCRKVLDEIAREVHGATDEGGIHEIAEDVAKDTNKLCPTVVENGAR